MPDWNLILLPDVFHVCLCQLLIFAILLLPLDKSALENINLLLLALLGAESTLTFTGIAECSRGPTLLAKSTVEDDLLLVFQSAK